MTIFKTEMLSVVIALKYIAALELTVAAGGWGESCYFYEDSSFAGIGKSTPSQTAWAVLALQSASHDKSGSYAQHAACLRGLTYLRETQVDGTWNEREYTGTGFPRDFYINYHLYRHVFPTMALAGACKAQVL